ncbi:MAG: DUF1236 domain-containing protein [Xanthobacteraceae bacterium]|nr:DUF1236 domain-containing protein [Xanthobacteraceae bacterium]
MPARFMTSVAILTLLAGSNAAFGQGTGAQDTHGGAAQHSPSTPPQSGSGASSPMNRSQSQPSAPGQTPTRPGESERGMRQNAQEAHPGGSKSQQSSGHESKGDRMKSSDSERQKKNDHINNAERRGNETGRDTQGAESRSHTTTGQAGAGAKLSTEQRTKITTVIRDQRVQPETNINFNVSVGTHVPRTVHFHPLPTEIVTIYPDWRGYEFFLVRGDIIVVNPRTMEIVAVLPA